MGAWRSAQHLLRLRHFCGRATYEYPLTASQKAASGETVTVSWLYLSQFSLFLFHLQIYHKTLSCAIQCIEHFKKEYSGYDG